jgi:hypothetical protein
MALLLRFRAASFLETVALGTDIPVASSNVAVTVEYDIKSPVSANLMLDAFGQNISFTITLTQVSFRLAGNSSNILLTHNVADTAIRHRYTLEYDGSTTVSLSVDGVFQSSATYAGRFRGVRNIIDSSSSTGLDLYGFKVIYAGVTYDYQPTLSGGTGTTLTDAGSAGNDGTLTNFTGTTNSWWVSYSSAITVADTLKNINVTSLNETVTIPEIYTVNDTVSNTNITSINETVTIPELYIVNDLLTNINIASLNETVTIPELYIVNDTLTNINITSISESVFTFSTVVVSDSIANVNLASLNDTVLLSVPVNVNDSVANIGITSINETMIINVTLVINDTLKNISITPINDTVIIAGAGWVDRTDPTNTWTDSISPANNWTDRSI